MGRSSVPYDVQIDVAKNFWKYLKQSEPKPDTRVALRELYLESYRPLLVIPAEQRVNFSTVFYCMKTAGFLKPLAENRDRIVYQKLKSTQKPEVQKRSERVRADINEASSSSKNPSLKAEPLHQRKNSIEKTRGTVSEQEDRQKDGEDLDDLIELRKKLDTQSQRHHLVKDKGNVTISPLSNQDGVIDLGTIDSSPSISFQLHIRNENGRELVFGCAVLKSVTDSCNAVDPASYNVTVGLDGDELDGFEHIAVPVEICGHKPGLLQVPLAFWFRSGKGQPFYIVKYIKAEITAKHPGLLDAFGNLTELRKKLVTNRRQVVKDKGKIVTSPASNTDGVIDLGVIENTQSRSFQLYITNQSDKKLDFKYAVLESASDCNVDTTSYEVTVEPVEEELDGFECISIPVEISGNKPGVFYVPLVFWFKSGKGQPFYIVKFIRAEISANLVNEPAPSVSNEGQGFGDLAELRKKLVTNRHHLAKDKGDIIIFPASNTDGVIDMGSLDVSESKSFQIHIRNKSERKLQFGYVVLGSGSDFRVDGTDNEIDEKMGNELGGYECVPVGVEISANNPGIFHVTLAFWFKCGKGKPFHIVKFIKAEVTDNLVNDLQPTSPYVRPKAVSRNDEPASELIRGEPPPFDKTVSLVKLAAYSIPGILKEKASERSLDSYLTKVFRGDLTAQNHRDRFSKLLHSEEMQMQNDIRRYDMEKVELRPVSKQYLALAVPGLAENRPSLVCGDRLFVRKLKRNGKVGKKMYEGFVHRVELNEVHLKFCSPFHKGFVNNMLFNVQFTFSRTPLKLMHRALDMARTFMSQLPYNGVPPDSNSSVNKMKRLRYYDPNVASNEEQKQAVENILLGTSRPYPYLVFGPPGSGKTVTMVEAIKQVLKNFPESKVLACAPSNSAADLILERVSKPNVVPNAQMIRLNAYGRNVSSVQPSILKFCKKSKEFFCFPPKEEIKKKYRLVVTTLISAGRLVSMNIGNSHFTHVFIDEAGHGMEPECLVPIAGLYKTGGQLVLAGDPKQLGPVLRSPEAISFGLSVSLLERLMGPQFPCFNRQPGNASSALGTYSEKLVTKLLNNYRSHPAIIKLPNEMFYDNELRACADQLLRESLCQWNGLEKKGFPVVFEGVCGKDQREEKSPSFFNPQEVSVVLRYVKDLKDARGVSVKMEEIGIISPYHRQVQKIRQSLDKKHQIRDIKVGSVEEFQGQERKVIIISTVRSTEKLLHLDATFKLGFLRNPKRFNVATTRAKALLVVIGNPHVLCKDEFWRRFIQYCLDNGSYKGCAFEMPQVDDENLAAQLANLGLNDDEAFYADVENTTSTDYEDQEWKLGEH